MGGGLMVRGEANSTSTALPLPLSSFRTGSPSVSLSVAERMGFSLDADGGGLFPFFFCNSARRSWMRSETLGVR